MDATMESQVRRVADLCERSIQATVFENCKLVPTHRHDAVDDGAGQLNGNNLIPRMWHLQFTQVCQARRNGQRPRDDSATHGKAGRIHGLPQHESVREQKISIWALAVGKHYLHIPQLLR